jgi:hypothetical protein
MSALDQRAGIVVGRAGDVVRIEPAPEEKAP